MDENGGNFPYPVPRFRQGHDTAKIQPVKGLRVEILRQQNTTRPLTGWIGVAARCMGNSVITYSPYAVKADEQMPFY